MTKRLGLALFALLCASQVATAADAPDASSGFLSDYSLLKPSAGGQAGEFIYVAPDAVETLVGYSAVMVDQPAFALAPDSKLKSMKPDDAKIIADAFREVITNELAKKYTVTSTPGKGVLGLRTSFSNVYVEKKGRGILGYTPVGFVVTTAKGALVDDVLDKVKLAQTTLEAELVDSESGAVLAAVQDHIGNRADKKEFTSWKEANAELNVWAQRVTCNLDNARVVPASRQDCTKIVAPVEAKKQ
jgi:hypothetical protein